MKKLVVQYYWFFDAIFLVTFPIVVSFHFLNCLKYANE